MRTTLDIDDDVLVAVKDLARRESKSVGRAISELVRKTLADSFGSSAPKPKSPHGFRPFPRRGGVVTNQVINRLRERDVY